ncbi:MAG: glycosyltransferase family 2 protein [Candidatus Pacebacteria bacterium]|nr:glycosyltransferase family 2 protein [Candidatus Paceibacterota bacterium]MDD4074057.1 glycosyltransferase family 2 protein [Candidatus Paceibacterota bacterium]
MNEKYYLKIGRAVDLENIKEKRLYRFFEMLVPLISLSVLFLAIFFSWKLPIIVAFFIIIYDIYWFFRTIYFAFYLKAGYVKMRKHENEDWLRKLEELGRPTNGLDVNSFKDIFHLIILPTFREPIEVVKTTMENLLKTDYPKDKMIVVFACEEADRENAEIIAKEVKEKYGDKFFKFLITFHPSNLEGELAGHGANDAWATKEAKKIIDKLKIPYKNILVSSFDIDACVYPKYFSCLTYYYLTVNSPLRTSFQPIPLYLNNVWETHSLSRVFSFTSTYWHTMNQERPEKLVTFSSHSMPFKALNDVGFKQRNVVSDDSRIFWQCFFEYDGDYRVEPIYYPISMDANCAENLFTTLKNIYKQQKRWAYGVGEIPFFLFASIKNKKISFKKKFTMGFDLIEGHISWAVSAILIFLLGWLPLILGGAEFSQTLLSYNLPKVTGAILTITMSSLIMSIWLSMLLLPPRPAKYGKFKHFLTAIEWIMIPFVMIFFSALPALHAQMHWLFGKYMGFWVTPKVRK